MATLNDIYRDVNSKLTQSNIQAERFFHKDVIKAINDAIASLRLEFIQNHLGNEFVVSETVETTSEDSEYPFLRTATLTRPLLRALPIAQSIRSSIFWRSPDKLENSSQTWSEGDLAVKGEVLYKAVRDVAAENTFDRTFEPKNIRTFYASSGLSYKQGDVVQNNSDGTYWRATQDYEDDGTEMASTGAFEQLSWKKIGDAFIEASYLPFSQLYEAKLKGNIDAHYPFAIRETTVYTSVDETPFTISYIPEWQNVEVLTNTIDIPDVMVPDVKTRATQILMMQIPEETDDA